jgi:low affinity Fe/Cu permease
MNPVRKWMARHAAAIAHTLAWITMAPLYVVAICVSAVLGVLMFGALLCVYLVLSVVGLWHFITTPRTAPKPYEGTPCQPPTDLR